jgi:glycosyltransferase involved in cell wall biosynthesis
VIPILHLITTLDVGGAETALLRLVTRLDRRRFACTVVSLKGPGTLVSAFRREGIDVIVLGASRTAGAGAVWRLARVIRRIRPALVQTWLYHADLVGLLAARLAGVPVIAWNIRCSDLPALHPSRSTRWIRTLLAQLSRVPQAVVVNSEAGRAAHERLGYRPRRWALIPNGFDTEAFAPSDRHRREFRQTLGIAADAPAVGLIARWHPMKDHHTFLAAMQHVAIACPALRVVLAGRGIDPGNAELRRLIGADLRDRVLLLGEVDDPARILPALDLTVSSSAYGEGFPNVVAESLACGTPVVATDVGDSARILDGLGTVVAPRDPEALAAAVGDMLGRPRRERAELGLAGRRRVLERYSLEQVVGRYEELYGDLLAERRP